MKEGSQGAAVAGWTAGVYLGTVRGVPDPGSLRVGMREALKMWTQTASRLKEGLHRSPKIGRPLKS